MHNYPRGTFFNRFDMFEELERKNFNDWKEIFDETIEDISYFLNPWTRIIENIRLSQLEYYERPKIRPLHHNRLSLPAA